MLVYLVRHGKAEVSSASGLDRDRELRGRGKRQSRWLADHLSEEMAFGVPSLILASPYARATQTAQIIGEITGAEIRFEESLELGCPAEDVIALIAEAHRAGEPGPLMLVGHNPQMEILLASLASGAADDGEMRTGMAAVIEIDGSGSATLITKLRSDD